MKKYSALLFSLFFAALVVTGQTSLAQIAVNSSEVFSRGFVPRNFVKNSIAQVNTKDVATTNAAVARDTTNKLDGVASFTCDTSASSGFCEWDSSTIVTPYTSGTCEVSAWYRGDGSLYSAQAYDGTGVVIKTELRDVSTTWTPVTLNAPCSSTLKFRVTQTTAGTSPAVNVGKIYVGPATNIANANFSLPAKAFTPTGSWSANTTYAGRWWRVSDRAHFEVQVSTSGAPTSAALTVNFGSVCTADTTKLTTTTRNDVIGSARIRDDSATTVWNGSVRYDTTTTVAVLSESASTPLLLVTQAAPMTWAANDTVQLSFSIPCEGWSASDAVVADSQRPPNVIRYTSGSGTYVPSRGVTYLWVEAAAGGGGGAANTSGGGGTGGNTSFGAFTASGGTGGLANGVGGYGGDTNNTAPYSGCVAIYGNSRGAPGGTGAAACGGNGGGPAGAVTGCGANYSSTSYGMGSGGAGSPTSSASIYGGGGGGAGGRQTWICPSPPSSLSYSVGTGGSAQSAAGSFYGATAGSAGYIAVTEYFGAVNALLARSVSTSTFTGESIQRATITNSGTAAIASQSGAWLSSATRNSAGNITVAIVSGTFSAAPTCYCSGVFSGTRICQLDPTTPVSTTAARFQTAIAGGTATDTDLNVICMGPK